MDPQTNNLRFHRVEHNELFTGKPTVQWMRLDHWDFYNNLCEVFYYQLCRQVTKINMSHSKRMLRETAKGSCLSEINFGNMDI